MASGKSLARTKSGLRMLPNNEQDRSPFTIEEPPWQPDDQVCIFDHCYGYFLMTV